MTTFTEILSRPIVTEKTTTAASKKSLYSFEVNLSASKTQIKEAVEKLFDVKVIKVNTVVMPTKSYRTKLGFSKSKSVKKAHVELRAGQKIELFKSL